MCTVLQFFSFIFLIFWRLLEYKEYLSCMSRKRKTIFPREGCFVFFIYIQLYIYKYIERPDKHDHFFLVLEAFFWFRHSNQMNLIVRTHCVYHCVLSLFVFYARYNFFKVAFFCLLKIYFIYALQMQPKAYWEHYIQYAMCNFLSIWLFLFLSMYFVLFFFLFARRQILWYLF